LIGFFAAAAANLARPFVRNFYTAGQSFPAFQMIVITRHMDYNATVNLPKTDFPMRAGLPKREPDMLKAWNELDLYHEMVRRNQGKPRFVLHDGPPFSNGMIHMGTALNKCIKDFINRYNPWPVPNDLHPRLDNTACPSSPPSSRSSASTARYERQRIPLACHSTPTLLDVQREAFAAAGRGGELEKLC
jgi:isoleucyl-tRNA synthetase